MQGCEATSHVGKLKDYKSPYDTSIYFHHSFTGKTVVMQDAQRRHVQGQTEKCMFCQIPLACN